VFAGLTGRRQDRSAQGYQNHRLGEDVVQEIVAARRAGAKLKDEAERYGISEKRRTAREARLQSGLG
jgi:hypothetical protein